MKPLQISIRLLLFFLDSYYENPVNNLLIDIPLIEDLRSVYKFKIDVFHAPISPTFLH